MRTVDYFSNIGDGKIKCELCPHECILALDETGICNVRKNVDKKLIAENYSKLVSLATDPIEKKPLYHFYPSKRVLSVASYGCNFKCRWCQNWTISQGKPSTRHFSFEDLINYIEKNNLDMIAFTYSEPFMWYEYIKDFAQKIKNKKPNFKIILVTNGFIKEKPLRDIVDYIDAVNLDIKGMEENIYKKYIKGRLQPVLNSAKIFYENEVHIEITDLLVTDINDSESDVKKLARWIKNELSVDIPLHLSRYYPNYNMDNDPTPKNRVEKAYKTAKEILNYVYVGNIHIKSDYSNTFCPNCSSKIVDRSFFSAKKINLSDEGRCLKCGENIYIKT